MANFTVVYDACVLYPASIRDLVVELARTGLLRAKWTVRIHAEWINAVSRDRPELDRARPRSAEPKRLLSGSSPFRYPPPCPNSPPPSLQPPRPHPVNFPA
jgi:hypothetical protein